MSILAQESPLNQIIKTKLTYPVTLDEAKRHLRVDERFELDDDYISRLVFAATKKAEEYIGKDISLTSNVLTIDNFCSDTLFYDEGNFYSLTSVVIDNSTNLS